MKIVGLAGRPGSGKSAVARALSKRERVKWIDLDRVAWETYAPGTEAFDRLVERFGRNILGADGTIDRTRLGRIVFECPEARRDLEAIVHPAVVERLGRIRKEEERRGTIVLLVEGALLSSSAHVDPSDYDVIIWLEAKEEVRRGRLREEKREPHADRGANVAAGERSVVIDAEGSIEQVAERVWEVIDASY